MTAENIIHGWMTRDSKPVDFGRARPGYLQLRYVRNIYVYIQTRPEFPMKM